MAKKSKSPEEFWLEYEEKTGEKVLARCLGQYVSGWAEFDDPPGKPIWGLIIATSGGFRFHHFPQGNWLFSIVRLGSDDDAPKEKTIFIPRDKIVSAVLHRETKWYRKIFSPGIPVLQLRYLDEAGTEKEMLLYAEYKADGFAEALISSSGQ